METDPGLTVVATHADPGEGAPLGEGPMKVDPAMVGTPGDPPSQPGTPRSQPRASAPAHPLRGGLTHRLGLPAVLGLPPPIGPSFRRLRPTRQLAAGPQPAGVPGLP